MSHADILRARAFAAERHQGQTYAGTSYLEGHLEVVAKAVQEGLVGETEEYLVVAALLHDVLEDTSTTFEEIDRAFGPRVADLVQAVTGTGKNRKIRNAVAGEQILRHSAATGTLDALYLKLQDRKANVVQCWTDRDARLFMYQREYADFRWLLFDLNDGELPGGPRVLALWKALDGLLGWYEPLRGSAPETPP